jgi:hypothetical protein
MTHTRGMSNHLLNKYSFIHLFDLISVIFDIDMYIYIDRNHTYELVNESYWLERSKKVTKRKPFQPKAL